MTRHRTRLLDTYARTFDITETRVVLVDAEPSTVLAGLARLPLSGPAMTAIQRLGIADRLAFGPAALTARTGLEQVYGLVWRLTAGPPEQLEAHDVQGFAGPGYVKIVWDVQVHAGADTGATLASTMRFVATDDTARKSLRAAWALVGPVSTALSTRALATLRNYAEENDELTASQAHRQRWHRGDRQRLSQADQRAPATGSVVEEVVEARLRVVDGSGPGIALAGPVPSQLRHLG
jgi:hypothetical protein